MLDRLLGGRLELFQLGFAHAELPGPREILPQTRDLGLQVRGLLPPLGDFGVRPRGLARERRLALRLGLLGGPQGLSGGLELLLPLRELAVLRLGNLLRLGDRRIGVGLALRGVCLERLRPSLQLRLRFLLGARLLLGNLEFRCELDFAGVQVLLLSDELALSIVHPLQPLLELRFPAVDNLGPFLELLLAGPDRLVLRGQLPCAPGSLPDLLGLSLEPLRALLRPFHGGLGLRPPRGEVELALLELPPQVLQFVAGLLEGCLLLLPPPFERGELLARGLRVFFRPGCGFLRLGPRGRELLQLDLDLAELLLPLPDLLLAGLGVLLLLPHGLLPGDELPAACVEGGHLGAERVELGLRLLLALCGPLELRRERGVLLLQVLPLPDLAPKPLDLRLRALVVPLRGLQRHFRFLEVNLRILEERFPFSLGFVQGFAEGGEFLLLLPDLLVLHLVDLTSPPQVRLEALDDRRRSIFRSAGRRLRRLGLLDLLDFLQILVLETFLGLLAESHRVTARARRG